ncbi:M48 family metallopeptidase [Bizionia myxarmorum]|uniref:M48 family metallopeptidase n=1 Tax=Bizionia myxarmorum TaxID=291186 RepID=A0A5D0REQ2_9FLAO|nr:SprT family zinc-dependent metalloprotease [Bizionia myxarmorum]TYB79178.1 M48 family metallopeptidase [Bizionia myxarmorum]
MEHIELGSIKVEVEKKDIKNIHLSVYPPDGAVRIAAPNRMDMDTIRVFALNKLKWIKKQQETFKNQERETPREYLTKESHYFLGKRYLLQVIEHDQSPKVILKHETIELYIKPNTSLEKRKEVIDEWYRSELKSMLPKLISKWEIVIGVQSNEFSIKKMRTKWGTCNTEAKRIWLNLELAKKPLKCIEFIIVHELVHLLERSHSEIFVSYMNEFMPKWRLYREELNNLPFRHVDWKY